MMHQSYEKLQTVAVYSAFTPRKRGTQSPRDKAHNTCIELRTLGRRHSKSRRKSSHTRFDFTGSSGGYPDNNTGNGRRYSTELDGPESTSYSALPTGAGPKTSRSSAVSVEECGGLQMVRITDQIKVKEYAVRFGLSMSRRGRWTPLPTHV